MPQNTTLRSIWIRFRSDDVGTANGFEAFYELVHGVDLAGEEINSGLIR